MQVHPDIAALRSDRAPQREAQAAMLAAQQQWAAEPGAATMLEELDDYGKGAPLEACRVLEAMFTVAGEAERLLDLMSQHYCRAIAANPIGHPPFRHGFDGKSASILLASAGRAQLMIQAKEPGEYITETYGFSDATRLDAVLGGAADARLVGTLKRSDGSVRFREQSLVLQASHRLALDLGSETLVVDRVQRRLVVLRLLRTARAPQPSRDHDAASGRLLHQSAGHIGTSRQEAIIALLGRMGREDAVPEIVRIALGDGDSSLRWQALREALALDTGAGFGALSNVAQRGGDALAAQAGALRARLLEAHPQLVKLETDRCPA